MIARALAILEALKGGTVDAVTVDRIVTAFIPDGIDAETLTNEEKATYFVREMRRMTKLRVLQSEEEAAAEAARLAARVDIETNVDLGTD
jgi:hypothetical protein